MEEVLRERCSAALTRLDEDSELSAQPSANGADAVEGAADDPESAAEPTDRIDLAVTRPADHETDLDDRAAAERREHAPELALPRLAGAAEQLEVGEVGEVTGELLEVTAEHGDPPRAAHHAYFPPRATRRARE